MKKINHSKKRVVVVATKSVFWFFTGVLLGLFFFISFAFIIFKKYYDNRIFPGITIQEIPFGGKTQNDVKVIFSRLNDRIKNTELTFIYNSTSIATTSAANLQIGYNENLLAEQAYSIGRSKNLLSNISLVIQAYAQGVNLQPSYTFNDNALQHTIEPIIKNVYVQPIDALFTFENGKVTAFQTSSNGQEIDKEALIKTFSSRIPLILQVGRKESFVFQLPVKITNPKVTTDKVNNLGIKELIGTGTSLFQHSIPNRIYNITLATEKFNRVLIAPNETFSFGKILGDVSTYTGYKQAYIIQNGKTILGDGGGICQISTTLFRALLNAGLSITERHSHDYRVGYYEQDSPPGFDATVYVPSVDLKFTNDTGNYILIQTQLDVNNQQLTFLLYGAKDGRETTISKPTISNQTPAPEPLYQDDPTLPKGTIKQIDFAAPGAKVFFTRAVIKNGKKIIDDKFVSNYQPWKAVYLRGTKE